MSAPLSAVRRTLLGTVAALVLMPAAVAFADPTPTPSAGPATTTDCGQVVGGQPVSPPPPGVVCVAGGINPAGNAGGGGTSAGTPQLPRTGPAPVLPTAAFGGLLLLLGGAVVTAGRRRTSRA